jgi:hypothetical protein
MDEFIAKHREELAGVLSGFDRRVFRGTRRSISYPEGMMNYLWAIEVRRAEFGGHVVRVSERVKQVSRAQGEAQGRPMKYLASAAESEEAMARALAARPVVVHRKCPKDLGALARVDEQSTRGQCLE